jgi:hypothetical protein
MPKKVSHIEESGGMLPNPEKPEAKAPYLAKQRETGKTLVFKLLEGCWIVPLHAPRNIGAAQAPKEDQSFGQELACKTLAPVFLIGVKPSQISHFHLLVYLVDIEIQTGNDPVFMDDDQRGVGMKKEDRGKTFVKASLHELSCLGFLLFFHD